MSNREWKKRLGFKISIKSEWIYTGWYLCGRFEVPYSISHMMSFLQEELASNMIWFKIEVEKK